jgi:hypothetical protein
MPRMIINAGKTILRISIIFFIVISWDKDNHGFED